VTTPVVAASSIPVLTPRENPKSSAFTMSRLELGVDPTRTISADADQVHQHLGTVLGKGDGARLVAVVKIDRNLLDLEAV
jgi:hypothetical protein